MINIKVDPRMQQAIKKTAESQFISMSAFIKQAVEKHLQDQGVDWRKEPEKKGKQKRE